VTGKGLNTVYQKLQHIISMTNVEQLVHAFMTSRLDYCNDLLRQLQQLLQSQKNKQAQHW